MSQACSQVSPWVLKHKLFVRKADHGLLVETQVGLLQILHDDITCREEIGGDLEDVRGGAFLTARTRWLPSSTPS